MSRKRNLGCWIVGVALSLAVACGGGAETPVSTETRAEELAERLLIVDTHIDVPYRLMQGAEDVSRRTEGGDFDYPRARQGGLDVAFMSIFVPASYEKDGGSRDYADELIDLVEGIAAAHPEKFAIVSSATEARAMAGGERVGLALGIENGAPIEGDLANVQHFHDRGVRYITLAHSESNHISDSSYDENRNWNGLSPFGEELVAEMNRVGMMIDVSHVTDAAFERIIDLSVAPVIASHSSCRSFTPGWERNMSDEMIRAMAERGGVIQINFGSSFINEDYRRQREEHWTEVGNYLEEHHIAPFSDEAGDYRRRYFAEHPVDHAHVREVAAHIDHVVRLVGIDHVGLGSDFDGLGDSLPIGLEDVSAYPGLLRELLELGYTEEEIGKICAGNLLRVWSEVERVARELQAAG